MSQFATAVELRTYLDTSVSTGRYATTNLDFLLQAASDTLERATGRVITSSASNTARTFTTHGRAIVTIPDLRAVSGITLGGSSLTVDETYWLLPSPQAPDIYTGVQVRAFRNMGPNWYLAYPEWFDRNLDNYRWGSSSLPNDLVVTGLWGWTTTPAPWKLATMALAGYFLKHGDALLAGAAQTPEGAILDYSQYPSEAQRLIADWSLGEQLVMV
jgi:hypothetical protein